MSNAINLYDSKTSKAIDGQVLIVRRSRATKKAIASGADIKVPKCASVPRITHAEITGNIAALMPAIEKMIHEARQDVFGELCDTQAYVLDSEVDIAAVLKNLTAGRLNGEMIAEWFSEQIATELFDALVAKFKFDASSLTEEQELKVAKIVENHEKLFASLASGKTMLSEVQRTGLLKVLDSFAASNDSMGNRFRTRLQEMARKEVEVSDFL